MYELLNKVLIIFQINCVAIVIVNSIFAFRIEFLMSFSLLYDLWLGVEYYFKTISQY